MYKLLWKEIKKTGSIEAYLYLYDYRILNKQKFEKRETLNNNGDCNNNYNGCLVDTVLYYTAKSSLDTNKEIYLKGEFAYLLMTYNGATNIVNATKRYIIPRTWFDFEKVHYYDAKINNMVYDNCGRSLICN